MVKSVPSYVVRVERIRKVPNRLSPTLDVDNHDRRFQGAGTSSQPRVDCDLGVHFVGVTVSLPLDDPFVSVREQD